MEERDERVTRDAARIREALGPLPAPATGPALIMVAGLPGSGKSHFSRLLVCRLAAVLIQSDAVRRSLFRRPAYTPQESYWVFAVIHHLLRELLGEGRRVILDATNLQRRNRERIYEIAEETGARLIVVWVEVPPDVIFERMGRRAAGADRADLSEADWEVYQKLESTVEPIRHPHYVVDTSRDVGPVLDEIVRAVEI